MNKKILLIVLLLGASLCSQQIFADALLNYIANQTSNEITYVIGFQKGACSRITGTVPAKSTKIIGRIPPCPFFTGNNSLFISIGSNTTGYNAFNSYTYPINQLTRVITVRNSKNPSMIYSLTVSPP